jgi:hypothetical protein
MGKGTPGNSDQRRPDAAGAITAGVIPASEHPTVASLVEVTTLELAAAAFVERTAG